MLVAFSGGLSGVLVVSVNTWMNTPVGFRMRDGAAADINPFQALFGNPTTISETLHMTLAAYAATGLLVAGIHAVMLRRDRSNPFHRAGPLDRADRRRGGGALAAAQRALRRAGGRTNPGRQAGGDGGPVPHREARPLRIGGLPDPATRTTPYAIEIPGGLSFLAFNDFNAEVKGLDAVPASEQPPVRVAHVSFQVMVACGMAMMAVAAWGLLASWRGRRVPDGAWFLRTVALASPLGLLAIEAGWMVTEVGRQPWIIRGIMRTADAITIVPNLWISLISYTAIYLLLGVVVVLLLLHQFRSSPRAQDVLAQANMGTSELASDGETAR